MKKSIIISTLCCIAGSLSAQVTPPDAPAESKPLLQSIADGKLTDQDFAHMELQFNSSGKATFEDGKYTEGGFSLNGVRMQVSGQLKGGISYSFRQSFTRQYNPTASDNVSMAVEKAQVGWDAGKHFTIVIGKQFAELGGYEYWVAANRVRFYSDFNNTVPCFQAGMSGLIKLNPNQTIAVQLLNNTNASEMSTYDYGFPEQLSKTKTPIIGILGYEGYFIDRALGFHYGAGYGQLATNRTQLYLTAGNVWEKGPVLAYLDFMYAREGIDTKGFISGMSANRTEGGVTAQNVDYFTTIANIDYRLSPHWNVYAKGTYEMGNVYRANGIYEKGRYSNVWSVQACAEFFPVKNRDLRFFLHGLYKKNDLTDLSRNLGALSKETIQLSIGLEYILPVF